MTIHADLRFVGYAGDEPAHLTMTQHVDPTTTVADLVDLLDSRAGQLTVITVTELWVELATCDHYFTGADALAVHFARTPEPGGTEP